ncbi:MAG: hypothetical protein ACR5K9_01105 [Wolbachia sp.]
MKMKRLCALAVLLTSSLASAADDAVANFESQYYAGLNFGAGLRGGFNIDNFVMKPSIVLGYHYDKNSKFELEALTDISNITDKKERAIGASLLANYRFYPDLDIDPVKLYVSAGLGGYLQIIEGSQKSSHTAQALQNVVGKDTLLGKGVGKMDNLIGGLVDKTKVVSKVTKKADELVGKVSNPPKPSIADKILDSISYKLKIGVDCEITPQIVGTAGIAMSGQLSGLKAKQIPDATLEVGVHYNF